MTASPEIQPLHRDHLNYQVHKHTKVLCHNLGQCIGLWTHSSLKSLNLLKLDDIMLATFLISRDGILRLCNLE